MQSLASSKSMTADSALPELLGGGVWAQHYPVHYLNHWVCPLWRENHREISLWIFFLLMLPILALWPLTDIFKVLCSSPLSSVRLSTIPWGRGRQYKWRPLLVSLVAFSLVVRKYYYSLALKELWTELKHFSSNSVIASSIIKKTWCRHMAGVIFDFYTSHATGCLHIANLQIWLMMKQNGGKQMPAVTVTWT